MSSLSTDSLRRLRVPLGPPDCLKQRAFRNAYHDDECAEAVNRRYFTNKIYGYNVSDRERLYAKSLHEYLIYRR